MKSTGSGWENLKIQLALKGLMYKSLTRDREAEPFPTAMPLNLRPKVIIKLKNSYFSIFRGRKSFHELFSSLFFQVVLQVQFIADAAL